MNKRSYDYWMKISTIVGMAEVVVGFIPTFCILDYLSRAMTKESKDKYWSFILAFLFFFFYTIIKVLNRKNTIKIDALAKKAKEEEGVQ